MGIERRINPEQQLEILESLKPKLGKFFQEMVYGQWGLQLGDVRLVDEAGFGYTGIPFFGPELIQGCPHIDIAVIENNYKGPRSPQEHPKKIIFPGIINDKKVYYAGEISRDYGISVEDLLKGSPNIFSLPTIEVNLAGVSVLVPEPVSHVRVFAEETILYYQLRTQEGEYKIRQWFEKLKMIRDVSKHLGRTDVQQVADEMIEKSMTRWKPQNWDWMTVN